MRMKTYKPYCLFVTGVIEILLWLTDSVRQRDGGRERNGLRAIEVSVQCLNKMPSLIE